MPQWVQVGADEYVKRFSGDCRLQLIEIPLAKRGRSISVSQNQSVECEKMLAASPATCHKIALDVSGKPLSTEQLANEMKQWQRLGESVVFYIGGPDGMSSTFLQQCDQRWSLSAMTFPHSLVRVMLAEQLYRAWSILQGHPYHRA